MQKNRLKELDSLRGIAALAVASFHYSQTTALFLLIFKFGGTAVDLFFMISGFVIFMSVVHIASWRDFVKKRINRLYPTYWICLTITTLVIIINNCYASASGKALLIQFLVNITMFQKYFKVRDMDGPYWTLAIELMFYLLILIVLITKSLNKIELIGYIILFMAIIFKYFLLPYHPMAYQHVNNVLPLINHWPLFFAGILFYKQKYEKETVFRYISIIICLMASIVLFKNSSRTIDVISQYSYSIVILVYFSIFFLLIKDLLRFLKVKILLFLGDISYTFYLIHQYIGRDFIIHNLTKAYNINIWVSGFIALAFCVAISALITYYLEVHFRYWLNKYIFQFSKTENTIVSV